MAMDNHFARFLEQNAKKLTSSPISSTTSIKSQLKRALTHIRAEGEPVGANVMKYLKVGLLVGLSLAGACVSEKPKLGSHVVHAEPSKSDVLAKIGDEEITERDLM